MHHLHRGAHQVGLVRQNHQGVVRHQVVNDMDQLFADRDHLVVDVDHVDQFVDLVVVGVLQNRDGPNQVLVLTLADVVHQELQVLVASDHQKFQMDYFQDALVDVVDVDQQKFQMDYFHRAQQVDVELKVLVQLPELLAVLLAVLLALLVQQVELPVEQRVELLEELLGELRHLEKFLQAWSRSSLWQLSLRALSLQVFLHRLVLQQVGTSPGIFLQLGVQLLKMQNGRTRPSLGVLQGLPCYPSHNLLLIRKRGPLPLLSFCGPAFIGNAKPK
jgi:hypothetical protein